MVSEDKMSISEISEFSILPYTWNRKLRNLGKFWFTLTFYRFDCIKHGKDQNLSLNFKLTELTRPHASRQINKDTVYK